MSHNSMSSFWSGTDNNNDKSGIYYSAVVGKLTDKSFDVVIRFNLYEDKRICEMKEVFEITEKKVEINSAWLDQVDNYVPPVQSPSFRQRKSMWDSIPNPNSHLPYGFEEINPADIGKGGRGGNKDGKGKEENQNTSVGSWDLFQEGMLVYPDSDDDIIVPGPNDEDDFQMALLDQLGTELGLGIDIDSNEVALEIASKYGKEAAESFGIIDDFLSNLENVDEGLAEIISQSYALMTKEGQRKLETEGIS